AHHPTLGGVNSTANVEDPKIFCPAKSVQRQKKSAPRSISATGRKFRLGRHAHSAIADKKRGCENYS
ncbi:hypothetical protein LI168_09355, partial [Desulfovibrio desulfuricans]|uniref:hypothetical protein n=1 Tax=Desulfovibrio desulfuricans TaxID=876 RepID=UPI001D05E4DF